MGVWMSCWLTIDQDDAEPSDVACDPDWVLHVSEIRVAWRLCSLPLPALLGPGSLQGILYPAGTSPPAPPSPGAGQAPGALFGAALSLLACLPVWTAAERPSRSGASEPASGRVAGVSRPPPLLNAPCSVSAFSPRDSALGHHCTYPPLLSLHAQEVKSTIVTFLVLRIPMLKIKMASKKEVFEANLKTECDLWHLMVKEMWAGKQLADAHKVGTGWGGGVGSVGLGRGEPGGV